MYTPWMLLRPAFCLACFFSYPLFCLFADSPPIFLIGENHTSSEGARLRESWGYRAQAGEVMLAYEFNAGARPGVNHACDFLKVCPQTPLEEKESDYIVGIEEPLLSALQGLLVAYVRALYIERVSTLGAAPKKTLLAESEKMLMWHEAKSSMSMFMIAKLQYPSVEGVWLRLNTKEADLFFEWMNTGMESVSVKCDSAAELSYLIPCVMQYALPKIMYPFKSSVDLLVQGLPVLIKAYIEEIIQALGVLSEELNTVLRCIPQKLDALASFQLNEGKDSFETAVESFRYEGEQFLYEVLLPHRELCMLQNIFHAYDAASRLDVPLVVIVGAYHVDLIYHSLDALGIPVELTGE
ncbi:MAG TPA: hypothetical protein DIU37_01160 [Opitutae bacterium]|nr:hypothetical protein [Opitutae bacterium]|tara:strand:- start:7359 stop:8417 length:1059 start_codon:yes stop_codon:yes gene_type:complete